MARIRFKKPKIAVLMSEVISLTIWLFLGDKVISVLNNLVGVDYNVNITDCSDTGDCELSCDNESVFEDAYEILGLGYSCEDLDPAVPVHSNDIANTSNGLLGVIGLVMVVMVLMNFVTYN